jgi:hypothetical protein
MYCFENSWVKMVIKMPGFETLERKTRSGLQCLQRGPQPSCRSFPITWLTCADLVRNV